MKIIFYSPHPTHDIVTEVGYATHQRETIHALQKLGAKVFPIIMGGTTMEEVPYKEGRAIEHKGIKSILKKLIPSFLWVSLKDWKLMQHDKKAAQILEKAIVKHQPDLVYERSEYLQDRSVAIIKKYNIKYFVEVNAPFIQEMSHLEGKSIWLDLGHKKEKNKYQNADKVIVVSSDLKAFLTKQYKINPDKILVSPNRINKEQFLNQINDKPIVDVSFKNSSAPIIGFVGSILPHHYLPLLIDAFEKIINKGLKANLLIVGGGSLLKDLKEKVKNIQLEDVVIFTDKIPHQHIPSLIQKMDICVMPGSNWYGSPIKIFEYGILGKAVIAPDNGPVKDVMEHEKDGLLIQKNVKALEEALFRLIEDETLRSHLGENFKRRILMDYTWEKAGEMIINAYKSL
jgi:glycosyltransferase involved in cell wall biosynthesis